MVHLKIKYFWFSSWLIYPSQNVEKKEIDFCDVSLKIGQKVIL